MIHRDARSAALQECVMLDLAEMAHSARQATLSMKRLSAAFEMIRLDEAEKRPTIHK